jgi:tetratricopeptide (TPR) repeat protein
MKKNSAVILIALLLGWSFAGAQSAARRILIDVKDTAGKPVEKVTITMTSKERGDFKKVYTTNKKGQSAFLLPVEIKVIHFLLEKEGFQNHQETVALAAVQVSQEGLSYLVPFVLYRVTELTPDQRRQARDVDEKALGFFNRGIELFNAGQTADAIAQFEGAVGVKPDFVEALENLAAAHFRAEQYDKAIAAAEKAAGLNPQSAQMVKLIAVAYSKLGDEAKAVEYEEKLKSFPDTEFSAEELYNMGVIEANKGNDVEAARYFEKAALVKPDFALAHYHLGLCRVRLNDLPGAKTELEKYLSLEPEGDNARTAKEILASLVSRLVSELVKSSGWTGHFQGGVNSEGKTPSDVRSALCLPFSGGT